MPNIDRGAVDIFDTDGVILSIAAKNAAGEVGGMPASEYSWSSSDEAWAKLAEQTPHADDRELTAYERWAGTPTAGSGSATITVTHTPSGNTETLVINVKASGPGEIGLSASPAIPEPPATP